MKSTLMIGLAVLLLTPVGLFGQDFMNEFYKAENYADSTYVEYFKNGQQKLMFTIKGGNLQGTYLSWYRNGQVEDSLTYNNGQLTGVSVKYDKQGRLKSKETLTNDTLIESWDFFYKRGVLEEEQYLHINKESREILKYIEVKSSRKYVTYDAEATYKNLNSTGYLYRYYRNGQKSLDQEEVNGVGHGKLIFYYKNGEVKSECTLINNFKDGKELFYKKDGSVKKVIQWKLGEEVI